MKEVKVDVEDVQKIMPFIEAAELLGFTYSVNKITKRVNVFGQTCGDIYQITLFVPKTEEEE